MNRWRWFTVIVALFVLLFLSAKRIANVYTEYLWFANMGYSSVFITRWLAQVAIGVVAWLLFVIIVFSNVLLAHRLAGMHQLRRWMQQALHPAWVDWIERAMAWLLFIVIALIGVSIAWRAGREWETVLKFINAIPFNLRDPILHQDVATYVFKLPFYNLLYQYLLLTVIAALIATAAMYLMSSAIEFVVQRRYVAPYVKTHITAILSAFLLIKAFGYRLDMYKLLFDYGIGRVVVWGVGYTDAHIRLPVLYLLMALAIIGAILLLLNIYWRAVKLIAAVIIVMVGTSLLAGVALPNLVQQFIVKPNELMAERKYLTYNIQFTLKGFGLDDAVSKSYTVEQQLTQELLNRNKDTINSIRLWDYRPLRQTYDQLQEIRFYYDFYDVDVDRYYINGQYQQVTIAARELNYELLPQAARRWVSQRLQYTHGYGVCMSPVHEIDKGGLPRFYIKDIPPRWSGPGDPPPHLVIRRPEIYYGELDAPYVIVRTRTPEIDYPKGAGMQTFQTCIYQGKGGVPVGSLLRRILFALRFSDWNILLSRSLTRESRIMFYRQITQRVQRLAPFLMYDRDPYIVIAYGRLYWIIDAYTTTQLFPYSEPANMDKRRFNYIRNSVKVVIDAYNGHVTFYIADSKDPLVRVYARIFPALFLPLSDMPSQLRGHLRYPVDLFSIQSRVYCKYHMTAPEQFYNREDEWEIANEVFGSGAGAIESASRGQTRMGRIQQVEPYYVIMRLPGEHRLGFLLMLPFTPVQKDNMIAWMAAHCDPPRYGDILVYRFPKGQLIQGPMQIEARIDQDPEISRHLSLWQQRGSDVIRGNLLVIPMDHSLLYVEPLYLRAEQSEIPELKRVIVASLERVVMATTLDSALRQLVMAMRRTVGERVKRPTKPAEKRPAGEVTAPEIVTLQMLVDELAKQFENLNQSARQGKWAEFGKRMKDVQRLIQRLKEQVGTK